jgi:hypothetical protein
MVGSRATLAQVNARFVGLLVTCVLGCRTTARDTAPEAGPVDFAAEGAKLVSFLPADVGRFSSAEAATATVAEHRVAATREYTNREGRTLTVRIATGDVSSDRLVFASDEEHAFGSDTPTYWRTTNTRGFRTRIAEERPTPRQSESYVEVGRNHVVVVRVFPAATAGESATLAAQLDLPGLAKSGGVAGPTSGPTRR